jgi:hypothetical protein
MSNNIDYRTQVFRNDVYVASGYILEVGTAGLRFQGDEGVPVSPQNGDHWMNSGAIIVRTNDENKDLGRIPHGEIWGENQGTALTLTTQSQWYQYNQFEANGLSWRTTPDYTQSHIEVDEDGRYRVTASIMFDGTGGEEYEWEVQLNSGVIRCFNLHTGADLVTTTTSKKSCSISGLRELSVDDTVELWVRCVTAASTVVTGRDVNLTIEKISN